jgi:NADPH:quinone reductase-like Zn-dependent oxidoreductase
MTKGEQMRAVQIDHFGGPEVLNIVEVPNLVRIHAVGVNLAETLMRENRYAVTPPLPAILGSESVGNGKLRVTIGGRYPLGRVAEAHRALQSRSSTGKLVLML